MAMVGDLVQVNVAGSVQRSGPSVTNAQDPGRGSRCYSMGRVSGVDAATRALWLPAPRLPLVPSALPGAQCPACGAGGRPVLQPACMIGAPRAGHWVPHAPCTDPACTEPRA